MKNVFLYIVIYFNKEWTFILKWANVEIKTIFGCTLYEYRLFKKMCILVFIIIINAILLIKFWWVYIIAKNTAEGRGLDISEEIGYCLRIYLKEENRVEPNVQVLLSPCIALQFIQSDQKCYTDYLNAPDSTKMVFNIDLVVKY